MITFATCRFDEIAKKDKTWHTSNMEDFPNIDELTIRRVDNLGAVPRMRDWAPVPWFPIVDMTTWSLTTQF